MISRKPGSVRVQIPLLDRLIEPVPDQFTDSTEALHNSVRRDLEALLNTRRRWRSWPDAFKELAVSPVGFGIPDFGAGAFNDTQQREELRLEIEDTIRRFEPRFLSVTVGLQGSRNELESTLRLRIDAVLHAEPAPEPISFDTFFDPSADEVIVVARDVT